jgi:two-component system, NarL family, nitrate/nitrite response regulator NarL
MSSSPSPLRTALELPGHVQRRIGNEPIRILIAAQTTFRECLGAFLRSRRGLTVVGEASDSESTVTQVKELRPHLLLLEASMLDSAGMSVIRTLRQWNSDIRIMILASGSTDSDTIRALQLGADGVVLKSDSTEVLVESIRRVTAGDDSIGKERVADLVRKSRAQRLKRSQQNRFGLTAREEEVIIFVLAGYPNAKIAKRLAVSEQTVKHHLTHIFDKLGVYSRVQLALFAVNHHLCDGKDEMRLGSVN